jgi:hypothetical protein
MSKNNPCEEAVTRESLLCSVYDSDITLSTRHMTWESLKVGRLEMQMDRDLDTRSWGQPDLDR